MTRLRTLATMLTLSATLEPILAAECPPVQGDLTIDYLNMYPESADWDPLNCVLYLRYLVYLASNAIRPI